MNCAFFLSRLVRALEIILPIFSETFVTFVVVLNFRADQNSSWQRTLVCSIVWLLSLIYFWVGKGSLPFRLWSLSVGVSQGKTSCISLAENSGSKWLEEFYFLFKFWEAEWDRDKQRENYLLDLFADAPNGAGWARSIIAWVKELSPDLPHEWQGPDHLNHQLLLV